jgi:hypothetical protein
MVNNNLKQAGTGPVLKKRGSSPMWGVSQSRNGKYTPPPTVNKSKFKHRRQSWKKKPDVVQVSQKKDQPVIFRQEA